ncbi:MAG: hybrid sensor histidine kinase/response regulator [Desulfobacter sp.]|nr:hybrid sensor histidine kinase/response regulator [Desulfobacter sp.]WDP87369.1 MAG: hybrid sensor histidine kinase/response regulator [Desulfobacter sp.]
MDKTKFSIMIVDDEADIREVLEIALADEGYEVILAEDGKQALELFHKARPLIVITDIKMPVMGGVELLRQVKQENPDTEVLMITGHGDMDLTISSLKFGAMDFITKPVNVDILSLSVSKAVEKIISRQKLVEYTQALELLVLEKSKLTSHLSSLGLMIGTISHDVKGVLTNLDGGLYLARSAMARQDTKGMAEGIDMLDQAIDRIKKLILDILMYSKERKILVKPVKVKAFAEEISKTMAVKIGSRPIRFCLVTDKAPEVMAADPGFMMSALVNILDNAIDACAEDGSGKDHLITLCIEEKKDHLSIRIQDNGCGMDMATREKIFELFYSSKSSKGTGFGLFIAHSIITQHKGRIEVESRVQKGTTFVIRLPLSAAT